MKIEQKGEMDMSSVEDVLRRMDSYNRKLLSDAIKNYEKTKSSAALKEVAAILENWNEDEAKSILPKILKK